MSEIALPSLNYSHWQLIEPDPQQVKAAAVLRDFNEQQILPWLAFARMGGFGAQPRSWTLGDEIVRAFLTLMASSDDLILKWVDEARTREQPIAKPEKAATFWCTRCGTDKPKAYRNHDEWRREEKEHESTYVCMLEEASGVPNNGSNCALCIRPSPEGCEHHVQACSTLSGGRYSCKRRYDMVKHLKKVHSVENKAIGKALAARWKKTLDKHTWACGFCQATFSNFQERLRHLQLHFEQGKTIYDWDINLVIWGLLQQPSIVDAWNAKLAYTSLDLETWHFIGREPAVKDLQHRLEVGPSQTGDSAEILVEAAYSACESKQTFTNSPYTYRTRVALYSDVEAPGSGMGGM